MEAVKSGFIVIKIKILIFFKKYIYYLFDQMMNAIISKRSMLSLSSIIQLAD
jgi:hypothetical protein